MKRVFAVFLLGILLAGCPLLPSGKAGDSFENPVVIQADNEEEGIGMEYEYLDQHACADNGGIAGLEMQELEEKDGHWFDVMTMLCENGGKEIWYFQIDSFFGKW